MQPPVLPKPSPEDPTAQAIVVDNASFSWDASAPPILSSISLSARCSLISKYIAVNSNPGCDAGDLLAARSFLVMLGVAVAFDISPQQHLPQRQVFPCSSTIGGPFKPLPQ